MGSVSSGNNYAICKPSVPISWDMIVDITDKNVVISVNSVNYEGLYHPTIKKETIKTLKELRQNKCPRFHLLQHHKQIYGILGPKYLTNGLVQQELVLSELLKWDYIRAAYCIDDKES